MCVCVWGGSAGPFCPRFNEMGQPKGSVHNHILFQNSFVNKIVRFPTQLTFFIFVISRASGNVNDLLNPLFSVSDAPNYSN